MSAFLVIYYLRKTATGGEGYHQKSEYPSIITGAELTHYCRDQDSGEYEHALSVSSPSSFHISTKRSIPSVRGIHRSSMSYVIAKRETSDVD